MVLLYTTLNEIPDTHLENLTSHPISPTIIDIGFPKLGNVSILKKNRSNLLLATVEIHTDNPDWTKPQSYTFEQEFKLF